MRIKLLIVIFISILFTISCKKGQLNQPTPIDTTIVYNDSKLVVADSAIAVLYTLWVPPYQREIDIRAYKKGLEVLVMHFLPKSGYQIVSNDIDGANLTYKYIGHNGFEVVGYCDSGNFNLSVCDTVSEIIKGTFDFSAQDLNHYYNFMITEGTINIKKITRQ